MTASRYTQMFGVTRRTTQRDLGKLVQKGQAKLVGQGAATAYIGA